jgi:hypothetical protein
MTDKSNSGKKDADGTNSHDKGEMKQPAKSGGPSVSKKGSGKHFKDDSGSQAINKTDPENTTKKQQNSV